MRRRYGKGVRRLFLGEVPGGGGLRLFRKGCQIQVNGHIFQSLLPGEQLADGEGHLPALGDGRAVHGLGGAEEGDGSSLLVPSHPLTAADLVKGQMETPAVKEIGGPVHIAAREGDIGLSSVALHPDAHHLHCNALVCAGALHRLEKLGYRGGDPVEHLITQL